MCDKLLKPRQSFRMTLYIPTYFLSLFQFSDLAGMLKNYIKQTTFLGKISKISIHYEVFSLIWNVKPYNCNWLPTFLDTIFFPSRATQLNVPNLSWSPLLLKMRPKRQWPLTSVCRVTSITSLKTSGFKYTAAETWNLPSLIYSCINFNLLNKH